MNRTLHRRGLLALGAAAATAARAPGAATAGPRNDIVDVHAHFLPEVYGRALADAGLKTLDGGMPVPAWSRDGALQTMDRHGVATAVLSVSSPGVAFLAPAEQPAMARRLNEAGAALKAEGRGRFGGFAVLPEGDDRAALAELDHALGPLGLDGVVLHTHHAGRYPGHPERRRLLTALNERKAVVFLHPTSPHCADCMMGRPGPLIEFPFETTRAAVDLIYSGALDACPDIRFILAHGGGALPYLRDRVANFASVPGLDPRPPSPDRVRDLIARFHYDTALASGAGPMAALLKAVPASQVMFGSDWPFSPEANLAGALAALQAPGSPAAPHLDAIFRGNAARLLQKG